MAFDSTASSHLAEENSETPLPRSSLEKVHVEPSCTILECNSPNNKSDSPELDPLTHVRVSVVQGHLDKAENYLECNKVDAAVKELTAAAERVKAQTDLKHSSMDNAIAKLTTLRCQATAPHPKAIELVRLRKTLPT